MTTVLRPTGPYTHDCDRCRYLGWYLWDGTVYDLYICGDTETGSVVARYGHDGPEYRSFPVVVAKSVMADGYDGPLCEALRRALG